MGKSTAIEPEKAEKGGGFIASDYNAIARQANLAMIRLVKSEFECAPDFQAHEGEIKLNVARDYLASSLSEEGDAVVAMFKFRAIAKFKRRTLLKGEAVYAVIYDIPVSSEENAALAFGRKVGQFAAYPYFRSLMSQYAWAAEANLPPLPVIATNPALSVKQEPTE